jgi:3-keto-disaccharide hydrolase
MIPAVTSQGAAMRATVITTALFLAAAAGLTHVPAAAQTGGGFKNLFNGKNLSNWNVTGNADWQVKDGVIEATKARGFLVTKESYTDFELRADVWTTPDSNGGILFRITKPEDPGIENGYELNINDKRADQTGRTGSIVNVAKPLVQFDAGGKWVTAVITAKGPHMVGTLNGIKTAEADDAKYARGPVSLQAAGGIVRYRNVQIRELK